MAFCILWIHYPSFWKYRAVVKSILMYNVCCTSSQTSEHGQRAFVPHFRINLPCPTLRVRGYIVGSVFLTESAGVRQLQFLSFNSCFSTLQCSPVKYSIFYMLSIFIHFSLNHLLYTFIPISIYGHTHFQIFMPPPLPQWDAKGWNYTQGGGNQKIWLYALNTRNHLFPIMQIEVIPRFQLPQTRLVLKY